MLNRHRDHAREVVVGPRPLEVVSRLAHPARLAHHLGEELRATRRRLRREPEGGFQLEVVRFEDDRVAQLRMLVVAPGQQDDGPQIQGVSPPFAQDAALDLHAPDPLGVRRRLDGWNHVGEFEADRRLRCRVHCHALRGADEVARRERPALAFPLILRRPDDMAVLAAVLRVDMNQRLHPVVAGRELPQTCVGIAIRRGIDDHRFARDDAVHVGREEGHPAVALPRGVVGRYPGLRFLRRAEAQEEPPGQRTFMDVGGVADLDAEPRRRPTLDYLITGRRGARGQGQDDGQESVAKNASLEDAVRLATCRRA